MCDGYSHSHHQQRHHYPVLPNPNQFLFTNHRYPALGCQFHFAATLTAFVGWLLSPVTKVR